MTGASWNDDAIVTDDQDRLGRIAIADHIARLITENHSWDASRVYGLTGPWGSGKSSVINMVRSRLELTPADDGLGRWVVAQFTPWATSSTDALLVEFYSAFASALGGEPKAKKARDALGVCLKASAPLLGLIPVFGTAVTEGARAGADALTKQEPWERAFTKFAALLREMHVRVLIVADDIDRLQHDELVTLLKVVRLLGRFPGVDYLLAYDEATLFSNLTNAEIGASGSGRARLFMEKIVQYPLALPPLLAHQVIRRLDAGFTEALHGRNVASGHSSRIEGMQDLLVRQLSTPRSIDRYLAQVRFVLSMHAPGETDETDLLLVTLLHMQFPAVYARLSRWRGHLTSRRQSISDLFEVRGTPTPDFGPLFEGLHGDDLADAMRLVKELFPTVSEGTSRDAPHISNHYYFDRYLVHMVPEDDIADAVIASALEEASLHGADGTVLRDLLTTETVNGLPDLALDKMRRASTPGDHGRIDARATLNVVSAIAEVLPSLERGTNSLFRRQERAIAWVGDLVRSLPGDTSASSLSAALSACSDLILRMRMAWDAAQGTWELRDRSDQPRSTAVTAVITELVDEAAAYCVKHLCLRDGAAEDDSNITFALMYVVREGDHAARARVVDQLGDAFTTEDLAARCVSLSYLVGPRPVGRLQGFVDDLFNELAPADDPFYDSQKGVVDKNDLSWANRRAFARGRATPK